MNEYDEALERYQQYCLSYRGAALFVPFLPVLLLSSLLSHSFYFTNIITLTFLSPFLPFVLAGPVSSPSPSLLTLPLCYLMPSPPSSLTFLSPFFLSFLLVLFLLLFLSLLALTDDYLTPCPPLSLPPPTLNSFPLLSPTAPSLFPFSPHPLVFSSQPFIFLFSLLLLLFAFFLFFVPLKVTALLQVFIEEELFLGIFKVISQELGQTILLLLLL